MVKGGLAKDRYRPRLPMLVNQQARWSRAHRQKPPAASLAASLGMGSHSLSARGRSAQVPLKPSQRRALKRDKGWPATVQVRSSAEAWAEFSEASQSDQRNHLRRAAPLAHRLRLSGPARLQSIAFILFFLHQGLCQVDSPSSRWPPMATGGSPLTPITTSS
jgi:hypothetical protein